MARPRWNLTGWLRAVGTDTAGAQAPGISDAVQPTVDVGRNVSPLVAPAAYYGFEDTPAVARHNLIAIHGPVGCRVRGWFNTANLNARLMTPGDIPVFVVEHALTSEEYGDDGTSVTVRAGNVATANLPPVVNVGRKFSPTVGGWTALDLGHVPAGACLMVWSVTANVMMRAGLDVQEYRGVHFTT